jgi:hypothetical protein
VAKINQEQRAAIVKAYQARNPTPEDNSSVVEEVADQFSVSPIIVKSILDGEGVYISHNKISSFISFDWANFSISKKIAVSVVAFVVLWNVVYYTTSGWGGALKESQIASRDYNRLCSGKSFDSTCKGKFIKWTGSISEVPTGKKFLRIAVDEGPVIDLHGIRPDPSIHLVARRVEFSGYVKKDNWVYDDIDGGRVLNFLSSNEQALAEQAVRSVGHSMSDEEAAKRYICATADGPVRAARGC